MSSASLTEAQWREKLTPEQYRILREKDTEMAGACEKSGLEYQLKQKFGTKCPESGVFKCAGCGAALYNASAKFDSGCGWPAFDQGVEGAIKEVPDADGRRVEILCSKCDGHLGHVFRGEGFDSRLGRATNERHCVNGAILTYE